MKYCKKEDRHCSCPTCDKYQECKKFECGVCVSIHADIDYVCHSRHKTTNPKYEEIEKQWEAFKKKHGDTGCQLRLR